MIRPLMDHVAKPLGCSSILCSRIFGIESLFSIIIIILCLIIFFKTKEAFNLTKHKGIDYFRKTFLYLAFSYIFRFFFVIVLLSKMTTGIAPSRGLTMMISFIFVSFFSTMAIISLFLSISWKKLDNPYVGIIVPIVALVITIATFVTMEHLILVLCQAILILLTSIFSFRAHRKSRKFSKTFVIYVLLFIFWMIGLIPFSSRGILPYQWMQLIIPLSFAVFLIIFYKVHKWIK